MATTTLKPLHLAKNMKELNSKCPKSKLVDMTPKMLSKSSEKLFLSAYDQLLEGDQEKAYVLLLRYLEVVQAIKSSKEYKQNKKQVEILIDKGKFKKALEEAEKLSKELTERYASSSSETEASDVAQSSPDLIKDIDPNGNGLISCARLYDLLTFRPEELLVVDCRKRSDTMVSRVNPKKYPQWLLVPQEVIEKGNVTAFMSPSQQLLWAERGKYGQRKLVVLVDSSCALNLSSPLAAMKEILAKDDANVLPLILEGGYDRWYLSYGPLCIGKWTQKDTSVKNDVKKPVEPDLVSFSYPSSERLVPPKPKNLPSATPLPSKATPPPSKATPPPVDREPHPIAHVPVVQNNLPQSNGNYLPHEGGLPPALPLLPAAPSVPLPLQLERPDFMLEDHLPPLEPQPSYYLDAHWYAGANDALNPAQPYYDNSIQGSGLVYNQGLPPNFTPYNQGVLPNATPYNQGIPPNSTPYNQGILPHNQAVPPNDNQWVPPGDTPYNHGVTSGYDQEVTPNATPYNQEVTPSATPYNQEVIPNATPYNQEVTPSATPYNQEVIPNTTPYNQEVTPSAPSFPLNEQQGYYDVHSTVYTHYQDAPPPKDRHSPHVNGTHPSAQPYPPNEQRPPNVQRPSNEPHPPTAPRPSSTPATITNPAAASPVKQKHAVSGDDDVASSNIERDRALLDEKERELLKQREDMLKTSEDQWKMNKEQLKLMETERCKLAEEREEMRLQREREKERDRAELEQMKEKIQKEMETKLEEIRVTYEKEKAEVLKNKELMKHYWQTTRQQESGGKQLVTNQGLPPGWQKRLDRTTGRFYYVDHATKTTHWNPPTSLLQHQAELQRRQQPQYLPPSAPPTNLPSAPPTNSPSAPPTDPLLAPPQTQPAAELQRHQILKPVTTPTNQLLPGKSTEVGGGPSPPTVSRTNKPTTPTPSHPSIDRSSKPSATVTPSQVKPMSVEVYRRKMANLQPIMGSPGPGQTGLCNLGNTCFMNSVLQCLFATPPLMYFFVSNRYRTELNLTNPLGSGGEVAEAFFILCRAMWVERFKQVAPRELKVMIAHVAPYFTGSQQHDSQEFLMYFLDGLHEDLNRVKVKKYIENPDGTGVPDHVAAQQAWDVHRKRNNSIIIDLFYGILKSTIRCLSCNRHRVMFEPFLSLSVPIPNGRSSCSYTDCLKLFSLKERLSGDDKWYCPQCKQPRDAEKTLSIWRLPPVLILHFKRFKYDGGNVREKINTHISFPLENLMLDQIVVGPKPNKQYNLYAISNHIGNLGSGHYTACCKNAHDGRFYLFNDEDVRAVSSKDISSSSAYLLFYTCEDFRSLNL